MRLITCPEVYTPQKGDVLTCFMAGGITGTANWQNVFIDMLKRVDGLVLLNPRRPDFDANDLKASRRQIEWEFKHLEIADGVSFWFPPETLCPITLYELGKYSTTKSRLSVGCHQDYKRAFDVKMQLGLSRPELPVYSSLSDVANRVSHMVAIERCIHESRL